jgi:hypothetical protein
VNIGSERVIRWLIALMALCLAIMLTAAASETAMRAATLDRKARASPTNSETHGLRSPRAT